MNSILILIVVISMQFDLQLKIDSFWKFQINICVFTLIILTYEIRYILLLPWMIFPYILYNIFYHKNFSAIFKYSIVFFAFLHLANYILLHRYYFILPIRIIMLAAFNLRHYTAICSIVIKNIIPPSQNHQHRRFLKLL